MVDGSDQVELLERKAEVVSSASPAELIKEDIRATAYMDHWLKLLGFRWVENPVYQSSEINEAARRSDWEPEQASGQSVDLLANAINDCIFHNQPPEMAGYIQGITQERVTRFAVQIKYNRNIRFYRLPIVESPKGANDYLYFMLASGNAPSVFTALVEEDGIKKLTALVNPVEPKYVNFGPVNTGYASEDILRSIANSLTDKAQAISSPKTPALTEGNE